MTRCLRRLQRESMQLNLKYHNIEVHMTYEEAIAFIHGTHKFGSKLGLDNIKTLLTRLGSPQNDLKFIHVAGTNGKGSTCAFIHSILVEAGYLTGLYTSPYIETFNERMRVNHTLIEPDELGILTAEVKDKIDEMVAEGLNHPTEFEVVTAIAMLYFKKSHCDFVVLEVGLGGRLDATNVIDMPLVSVITPIDFDHMEYLGSTLEAIATEKGGIIKRGGITVISPQAMESQKVLFEICQKNENTCVQVSFESLKMKTLNIGKLEFEYKDNAYESKLFAPYQAENAAVAIETIDILRNKHAVQIADTDVFEGIKKAKWIGRLEVLCDRPIIIIDGAHNLHGVRGLARSLDALNHGTKIIGIMGTLKDKDVHGILDVILPYLTGVITTKPNNPRALSAAALANEIKNTPILGVFEDISDAVQALYEDAQSRDHVMYLGFGSLYMIGEMRHQVNLYESQRKTN